MTKRLSKTQQRVIIIREMIDLARFLTGNGVPAPQVKDAVGKLRDDLVQAYRLGITQVTVDYETYLTAQGHR